jgi:ATP-dependent RNA helicase DHX29
VPAAHNTNGQNTDLVTSTIAWAFYPKLLVRDGKGWRNIATNQSISIHPTSILRSSALPQSTKYLSFYSIMQSSGGAKNYNANSLTPVHPLALVLMAGEANWHQTSGVVSVDGSRMRFWIEGWKLATAVKYLRERLQECVERKWRRPELPLPRRLARWWEIWEEVVGRWEKKES